MQHCHFLIGRVVTMRKAALEDGDGHAEENGVEEKAEGPDAEADESFVERREVFDHSAEWSRDKAGNDQAHAFFDPDANDGQDTGEVEPLQTAADRKDEEEHGHEVEGNGSPDPGNQRMMAVQSKKQVFGRGHMGGGGV